MTQRGRINSPHSSKYITDWKSVLFTTILMDLIGSSSLVLLPHTTQCCRSYPHRAPIPTDVSHPCPSACHLHSQSHALPLLSDPLHTPEHSPPTTPPMHARTAGPRSGRHARRHPPAASTHPTKSLTSTPVYHRIT
jgi:hypothetical protein